MIAVITPTIRPDGLKIVETALKRQRGADYIWIIGSPFRPDVKHDIWVEDKYEDGVWSLNRIYNDILKEAGKQGIDHIASVQDYTFFDHDALSRFSYHLRNDCDIVSGVGDKYAAVYPEIGEVVWKDPRKKGKAEFRQVPFNEIEGNFCAINRRVIKKVGGFDESLDFEGYGMDWYGLLERLSIVGKLFYIDEAIESYSLEHGRADDWEEKNLIHGKYIEATKHYATNPKLKYL